MLHCHKKLRELGPHGEFPCQSFPVFPSPGPILRLHQRQLSGGSCVYFLMSTKAIAAVTYLKVTDAAGYIHIGFVMVKAKLDPRPEHSVPRLELCAAVLGVNNRVQRIRRSSNPDQWRYVPIDQDLADHATCFVPASHLQNTNWLRGPKFLLMPEPGTFESTYNLVDPSSDPDWKNPIQASAILIQAAQEEVCVQGIKCIQKQERSPKSSPLHTLDPFIDAQGLLRVRGHLELQTCTSASGGKFNTCPTHSGTDGRSNSNNPTGMQKMAGCPSKCQFRKCFPP
ncbi:hypothetical protein QQF64_020393 [Cirrhinus molitorella]|uniref:Uncharacterized protein n=1 Tax=Cirrhinus molitorella TaxID=172907 RepID=A0ABR3L9C0_9TELE